MLWLASASPARRRLLLQAGIPHQVRVSGVDEEAMHDPDPQRLVQRLAQAKARAVVQQLANGHSADVGLSGGGPEEPATWVLGCDSLLTMNGVAYGKPRDAADAISRWRAMAGGWGELHTGHCLVPVAVGSPSAGAQAVERLTVVTTRVQFAALTSAEIEAYVATGEPLLCAGGFALEGRGGLAVERIEGCFSNVIGLSLPLLRRWLLRCAPR